MADSSGASESVLSLPKGGGALKGIGETFLANPQTGAGKMRVPIELPQGRNGLRPSVDLHYTTGAGNGPFGLGWAISVPGVSLRTGKGTPRYRGFARDPTERDVFVLSGGEELVLVGEAGSRRRYRPATEGLFARIEHVIGPGGGRWEIATRDGMRSVYGNDASSRVADADDPDHVFAWHLSSTTDPFGNTIRYEYRVDDGRDPGGNLLVARGHELERGHAYNQTYLMRVLWVNYRPRGATQDDFLYCVEFDYGGLDDDGYRVGDWDYRGDPFSGYRAGFEIRTVRRCRRILVKLKEQGAPDFDVMREFRLGYSPARGNGVALLTSVELRGHAPRKPSDVPGSTLSDGTLVTARHRVERFPPLELHYGPFELGRRRLMDLAAPGGALPERGLADPEFELADLDGQGLPGILATGRDGHRYWRNLGNGVLQGPRVLTRSPANVSLADPNVQLADMQGDGRIDLVVSNGRVEGYYPSSFEGGWDARSFEPAARSPSVSLADPNVRLVDMDGDGLTDLLYAGDRDWQIHYNRGPQGWAGDTEHVSRNRLGEFPDVQLGDPDGHVKVSEMTGDGCSDIVLVRDGRVDYWPHMGRGRYGSRITMRGTPRIGYAFDARRVMITDVDGDGYSDFVYVGYDSVTLCLNQSGNSWSEPMTIFGTPRTPEPDAVRPADMLGVGTPGLLWSFASEQAPGRNYVFLDLTGGSKPYLLHRIVNNLGASTTVDYEPSSAFYVRDLRADRRWVTNLPFPVQCVARTTLHDEISGGHVVSEYRYHHGCWDGTDREFRGFARVDQWDAIRLRAGGGPDPVEIRTWYTVGPDELGREPDLSREYWAGDPPLLERPQETRDLFARLSSPARRMALRALRGQVVRTELYGLDGSERADRPYTVTEYSTALREEQPGIFFPHQVAQRVTQWERGDDPQTDITALGGHDQYGIVGAQVRIGVPRGRDPRAAAAPGVSYLTLLTETEYARRDDAQRYIVDRGARVTVSEVPNDGSQRVADLIAAAFDGTAARRLVAQSLSFYDGEPYVGLPWGSVGDFGALVRSESLAFTDAVLDEAFAGATPPYLAAGGAAWPPEYPAAFRASNPARAGYMRRNGGAGSPHVSGWYAPGESRRYDFHSTGAPPRGLVRRRRDPLGRITRIDYDDYALLPTRVTDPIGLAATVRSDYRAGLTSQLTDQNGNRKRIRFTPLGLVAEVYIAGKPGEQVGDPPGAPSTRYRYDFLAFAQRGAPISITTESRFRFATDATASSAERARRRVVVEYSDGFGRLLQTRSRAADVAYGTLPSGEGVLPTSPSAADMAVVSPAAATPGQPRVRVSGAVVYDGKGRPIERYERYFGAGFAYVAPGTEDFGRNVAVTYDVRGHPLRVIAPDGSEQVTVYGVPAQLDTPGDFEPTPWEAYSYDPIDNAGRTHAATSAGDASHWNTPASKTIDAWGRTVEQVARLGVDPVAERFVASTTYDVRGLPIEMRDALGRVVSRMVHDHLGRALRIELLDGGVRTTLQGPAGEVVETRDARGARTLHAYDDAGRRRAVWARDRTARRVCLREWREYGDELPTSVARPANLLGRPYRVYDGAGVVTFPKYDFAGQGVAVSRRAITDAVVLAGFDPNDWTPAPLEVDWTPAPGNDVAARAQAMLEPLEHRIEWVHDALGQLVSVTYPADGAGHRAVLETGYDEAGALSTLTLDGRAIVQHAYQDASGRPSLVVYGNGVVARQAYDELSGRLVRSRRESCDRTGDVIAPRAPLMQDLLYEHDLAGNVVAIRDRTPASGVTDNQDPAADPGHAARLAAGDALDRRFEYDALSRLVAAEGRICAGVPGPSPWRDYQRCGLATTLDPTGEQAAAPDVTALYGDRYVYDPVGNLLSVTRTTSAGSWTRRFGGGGLTPTAWNTAWRARLGVSGDWTNPPGNRTTHVREAGGPIGATHTYDEAGNLVSEAPDARLDWDAGGRLGEHRRQHRGTAGAWLEPEVCVRHLYDGVGRRTKTIVRRAGGTVESSTWVEGLFERRVAKTAGGVAQVEDAVVVLDNGRPLAVSRRGGALGLPALTLELGDHLGSATLSLDFDSTWTNREEFTPFGETAFGGYEGKHFRFAGTRRDQASGLSYHGARWYSPWLGRFVSCDPTPFVDGPNLYHYAASNPVRNVDRGGGAKAAYEIADAWEANPMMAGPITGERISHEISSFFERGFNRDVDLLPRGDGAFVSAHRNVGLAGIAFTKALTDVLGGMVATVLDPGFAIRGIMRIGTGTASGVDDISRGNTVLGASKIAGEAGQVILIVVGAARFGAPRGPVSGATGTITMSVENVAGSPVRHLRIGVQVGEGGTQWFQLAPDAASKRVGTVPVKALGNFEEASAPRPSAQTSTQTVPLADAQAALELARSYASLPEVTTPSGMPLPGNANFNIVTNNCTTFAAEIATRGGVMTPATFPTLTFWFFEQNMSAANMVTGAAVVLGAGSARPEDEKPGTR